MNRSFGKKFRVLLFSASSLLLILAFQNCGKMNARAVGSATIAQADSPPSSEPTPVLEPEPVADPPPHIIGGTWPNLNSSKALVTGLPECFTLSVESESASGLVLHAEVLTSDSRAVLVTSGKLLLSTADDSVTEIPASTIDSESGVLEFHATKEQMVSGGISGAFKGAKFDGVIPECDR